jgi:hypothetical protein
VFANPEDITFWERAFDAKFFGGEKWGIRKWDELLGDVDVRNTSSDEPFRNEPV